jgi:hypothetical protein
MGACKSFSSPQIPVVSERGKVIEREMTDQ